MLDLAFIRNHPDIVKDAARRRQVEVDIEALLELDERIRALKHEVEDLRARQNRLSKQVRDAGRDEELRQRLIGEGRQLSEAIKEREPQLREMEARLHDLLLLVPNIPDPSVPDGVDETENVEIARWGEPRRFEFPIKDHVTLMQDLDLLDIERGAKVAGSRSYVLKNDAARLELALLHFAMDRMVAKGFTPLVVPALAKAFAFEGTSHFPRGREQVYEIEKDELFLVGTAEVSVTGMFSGEILREEELPLRFAAYSPCFRREAGTYGKDTRGIMRVHQFNKVEQYVICRNDHEESVYWHETLRANAEEILQALELPYRVVVLCTGDLGDAKVKGYDLEAWVPSEGRYRETHSDSYFHDYQARRANIRYRDSEGRVRFVHTLNNTALATPRIMIPLLENHQQPDGSVRLPEALRPYMGGQEYIR